MHLIYDFSNWVYPFDTISSEFDKFDKFDWFEPYDNVYTKLLYELKKILSILSNEFELVYPVEFSKNINGTLIFLSNPVISTNIWNSSKFEIL